MCPLASALQAGGPTASGDSDKSKSEVNDEDEEVRERRAALCTFRCLLFSLSLRVTTSQICRLKLVLQGDE